MLSPAEFLEPSQSLRIEARESDQSHERRVTAESVEKIGLCSTDFFLFRHVGLPIAPGKPAGTKIP